MAGELAKRLIVRPLLHIFKYEEKKSKKKLGRPKVGQGSKLIAVTIEKTLLKRTDSYAKKHGIKRAQLIALGLNIVLAGHLQT